MGQIVTIFVLVLQSILIREQQVMTGHAKHIHALQRGDVALQLRVGAARRRVERLQLQPNGGRVRVLQCEKLLQLLL